jgi:hypothetical protein
MILERGHNINAATANGTALHEAAVAGKAAVVALLIDRSIDRTLLNKSNQTAAEALDGVQGSKAIRKLLWQAEDKLLLLQKVGRVILSADDRVQATVIADYTPGLYDKDALQLKLNEIITVTNLSGSEWWHGTSADNRKGKFPAAFVELGVAVAGRGASSGGAAAVNDDGGSGARATTEKSTMVGGMVLGAGVTQPTAPASDSPKKHNPFLDGDFSSGTVLLSFLWRTQTVCGFAEESCRIPSTRLLAGSQLFPAAFSSQHTMCSNSLPLLFASLFAHLLPPLLASQHWQAQTLNPTRISMLMWIQLQTPCSQTYWVVVMLVAVVVRVVVVVVVRRQHLLGWQQTQH